MREAKGDMWKAKCDCRVITTNGVRRGDGSAVMGAGVAKQASERHPGLSTRLGEKLESGNRVYLLHRSGEEPWPTQKAALVAFPTKHHFKDASDIDLIIKSAKELVAKANQEGWKTVVIPRPGCGLGGLEWAEVKPHLEEIWDERFWVLTP